MFVSECLEFCVPVPLLRLSLHILRVLPAHFTPSGSYFLNIKPLVSVLIPNYNSGRFLRRAILNVQRQSFSDVEIVVRDDCSTDNSTAVLARLATGEFVFSGTAGT
jgi:hypothetical protein